MVVCSCIANFKSKEFSLSYSEYSESCTIAELTKNLEAIVYKYNKFLINFNIRLYCYKTMRR